MTELDMSPQLLSTWKPARSNCAINYFYPVTQVVTHNISKGALTPLRLSSIGYLIWLSNDGTCSKSTGSLLVTGATMMARLHHANAWKNRSIRLGLLLGDARNCNEPTQDAWVRLFLMEHGYWLWIALSFHLRSELLTQFQPNYSPSCNHRKRRPLRYELV